MSVYPVARTWTIKVGAFPQPFATPADTASATDPLTQLRGVVRLVADPAAMADDAVAVLTPASTSLFGGNFGGNF